MLKFIRLDPITRKRFQRFRRIKRGYYSFLILAAATGLSLFSNFIANSRALLVRYEGQYYFPVLKYYPKSTFGQVDEYGFDDAPADYRLLAKEFRDLRTEFQESLKQSAISEAELLEKEPRFQRKNNWVLMPPIPYDPIENDFNYNEPPPNPPDGRHILGTDSQGRDVFARLLYGFRISILFSLSLVFLTYLFGTLVGCLQGYLSGLFDLLSQRFIEIWSTLPILYIVVILAIFFIPNFTLLLIIMTLFSWMGITYYMRTEMYREKTREYSLAAKALGASHLRIILRHLLPNCLTPLVTLAPFAIVSGIFLLTALDFLGYGLPAPTPSWGEMFDQAMQSSNQGKLWLSLSPFCAISITLILVTLIGEAVREAFDPKQFAKYR